MSPLSTVFPLQGEVLGGLLFVVYIAAILYLYVLLADIRRNTKQTATQLERLADALDADDSGADGVDEPGAGGGGDAADDGTVG